jgi:hypothetical protein
MSGVGKSYLIDCCKGQSGEGTFGSHAQGLALRDHMGVLMLNELSLANQPHRALNPITCV